VFRTRVLTCAAMRRLLSILLLATAACSSGRRVVRATDAEPQAVPGPLRLTVVTFNVQDLFVADRRAERMRAIARTLAPHRPDFIGLQEAFKGSHREEFLETLRAETGEEYEGLYFPSGVMGSGLYVVTRHPIEKAVFWRYSENGKWYQYKHGDWWAGKGVALVRLAVGGGSLDLFDTHAIANYLDAAYLQERLVQMKEMLAFIDAEATAPGPAIVLGDLNCLTRHEDYKLVRAGPPALEDLIEEISPETSGRVDHILVRPAAGYEIEPLAFHKLFDGPGDDGKPLSLSDHPGYVLELEIRRAG